MLLDADLRFASRDKQFSTWIKQIKKGNIRDGLFTLLNNDLSRILRILVTIVGKVKKRIGGK